MTNDTPGLHLIQGHDAAALAAGLARSLLVGVDDPFLEPLVLVHGAALQRWLSQQVALAGSQGIRAGVRFAPPAALEPLLTGLERDDDPWAPERLVWAVLEVADAAPPGLEPLVANLAASPQRFANAARVARLVDRYVRHRPGLLTGWSQASDADVRALGFDGWQAVLWHHLHDVVAGPDPVERRAALLAGLGDGSVAVPWPGVFLFGVPRLSAADAVLVRAVSRRVRVEAYAVVPGHGTAATLAPRLGRRGAAAVAMLAEAADTVLTLPGLGPAPAIEVHASHGPDRQVEVLREVLTGLFADDPGLEPRDVAVACVDVAALAPHLQAAFDAPDGSEGWQHPGTGLRVQVAGRAASDTNRLYALVREVAQLGAGRATATDLLALAAHPFVARRFGFDAEALDRLGDLVPQASIRWGLNPAHRAAFGLPDVAQGTWQVGVQRLLLGEALAGDHLASVGRIAPVDDVESTDVVLLGSLAELVTRASRLAAACQAPGTGATWVERFRAVVDQLADVGFDDTWQLAQVWSALDRLARRASASAVALGLADALAMLDAEFSGRLARPAFGNGSLVVGALEELAAVPHRVLCLVGLDERTFPRRGLGDGDDLLRADPATGDPDPGADDRQHLLDALGSARERLICIYRGHSTLTHEEHPPPAGLVDLIEASGATVVHEALQPFSPRSFGHEPTSFDRDALGAARALAGPRAPRVDTFHVGYLPLAEPISVLELDRLREFAVHPARYFLRYRANLTLGDDDPVADDLPLELDSLQRWKVGNRILADLVAGHPLEAVVDQEWRRGELPPGSLGRRVLDSVAHTASGVMAARAPWAEAPAEFHSLDVEVGGVRVVGRAATRGAVTLASEFGNVSAKHLVGAWLDALALTVQLDRRVDAVVLGGRRRHRLAAPPPDVARHLLGQAVDLAVEGLQRVLPLPPRVGLQWARSRAAGQDPVADKGLRTTWGYDRDATWSRFYAPGALPWSARVSGQPWARPGEPTELGSLAAILWAPLVKADT